MERASSSHRRASASSDGRTAAVDPFPAPHVLDPDRQPLIRAPRPEGAWRIGRGDVPPLQHLVHCELVTPEEENVDVAMCPKRAAKEQLDRVAAGNPPWRRQLAEQVGDRAGGERVPDPQIATHTTHLVRGSTPRSAGDSRRSHPGSRRDAHHVAWTVVDPLSLRSPTGSPSVQASVRQTKGVDA